MTERHENLQPADAERLADRLDRSDHMVLMDSAPDPDDDMVRTVVSADDHNFIVYVLRAYAAAVQPSTGRR